MSVTLTAHKAGTVTITATAADVADASSFEEIKGTQSVTIKINDPAPQNNGNSGNVSLKSIIVAGKTYNNPGTDFTVTVGADVGEVEIKAVANGNAKVSGTGLKELRTGTNTFKITVTNGGASKAYTVRIRKLADTTTTPNTTDEPNSNQQPEENIPDIQDLRLTYLRIEDVELMPEFSSEVFEYSLQVTNKEKLDIVAVQNVEDADLEIIGNEDLQDGENEIVIKISKEGQQDVEYRIIVTKMTEEVMMPEEIEENTKTGFLSTTMGKAVALAIGVIIIILIGVIIWKIRTASNSAPRARRVASRRSSFDDFND